MPTPLLFLASSLLLWLSSPGPGFSYLAWFALVPLFYACDRLTPNKAAWYGFFTGLGYYALLVYWIIISLGTYGHLPGWICGIALLLLAGYMALYLAFFCATLSTCLNFIPAGSPSGHTRQPSFISPIWIAPSLWVTLDFIRGKLFSGFPWQDLGYSQFNSPLLIQPASLVGHHGVTFLIVTANALIFSLLTMHGKPRRPLLPITFSLLLLGSAYGYSVVQLEKNNKTAETASTFPVAIIQGNINQDQKWVAEKQRQAMEKYITLSSDTVQKQPVQLVIWPETAMPFHPPASPLFPEILSRTVFQDNYSLLSGAPYFQKTDSTIDLYNSALLVNTDGSKSLYYKQHLVPFGEYIPLADLLPLPDPLVESVGNFSSGKSATPLSAGLAHLGILICFESIFPELARREVENGANLLVNITNDAWFGRSSASIQHLSMAVLRAVENRRSLARAANTGISCFIDPSGRITQKTELFVEAGVTGSPLLLSNTTFFTRTGHLFPLFCLTALLAVLLRVRLSGHFRKNR